MSLNGLIEDISMFTADFMMNFSYLLVVDVEHPEYLQPLHKDLLFLPEKIVIYEISKDVYTSNDKKHTVHNRLLQKNLNYG